MMLRSPCRHSFLGRGGGGVWEDLGAQAACWGRFPGGGSSQDSVGSKGSWVDGDCPEKGSRGHEQGDQGLLGWRVRGLGVSQSLLLQLEPWPEWDSPTQPIDECLSPGLTTVSPGLLHGCGQNQLDLLAWQGSGWRGLAHRPSVAHSRHLEASAHRGACRPQDRSRPGPCMGSHSYPCGGGFHMGLHLFRVQGSRHGAKGCGPQVQRESSHLPCHPPPLACPLFPITHPPPTPPDHWRLGLPSSTALVASVKSL